MTGEGGKAWVYGDDVDTDALAPGAYMKAPIEVLAAHCLEAVDPGFAAGVRPGDVVDRKSTRLNSSHQAKSRMPSSA